MQLPRDGAAYVPGSTWRSARAGQVGLDARRIDALVQRIESNQIRGLQSLIIVRHGYVVTEKYCNGSSPAHVRTLQSVSKSITSLIAGAAVDAGSISPATPFFAVLPDYADLAAGDSRKARITIGDLLAMRAGIDFHESPYQGSPLQRLNDSAQDWVRIALAEPMNAEPGTRWQYNSGGVIAIAGAVQRATGRPFSDFAREKLFAPIGVTNELWARSPFDGLPHTGGGLSLKALDLARIGYLVLRDGRWGATRVISSGWIRQSMQPRTLNPRPLGGSPVDYGYLWWLFPVENGGSTQSRMDAIYAASGNLNNWLFIVPRHDLVVVVTGMNNDSFGEPVQFLLSGYPASDPQPVTNSARAQHFCGRDPVY